MIYLFIHTTAGGQGFPGGKINMQRLTISVDDDLAASFDALVAKRGYTSRSEAMRELVRRALDEQRVEAGGNAPCIANLSYVFDHHLRDLSQRLTEIEHDHHELVVSTTHVHLDHDTCLESAILRGPIDAVRALANAVQAERGVRFGALNLISR